jgi:hypothetical protein
MQFLGIGINKRESVFNAETQSTQRKDEKTRRETEERLGFGELVVYPTGHRFELMALFLAKSFVCITIDCKLL